MGGRKEGKERRRKARYSSDFFTASCRDRDFFLFQVDSQQLDVARQDGQSHIPFKTVDPVIGTAVQSMDFQGINGRLNGGVLASASHENIGRFKRGLFQREPAFLRQYRYV